MSCPIAIVGMACRYPGADTVEQLFEGALAQRRAFRRIPDCRLGAGYFDESGRARDRSYARQAAVLTGFAFDRERFRVSRTSYEATDLTHWLALTVAGEALEDIRLRRRGAFPGNDGVRVVVGNTLTGEFSRSGVMRLRWPYVRGVVAQHLREEAPNLDEAERERLLRGLELRYKAPFPVPDEDSLAGGLANTIAGRICNHFDFRGGGYTVDGACASSLLAVIDACSALAGGQADLALAGGVDLSLDPFELVGFSRTAALARTEMLVYDEHSEGFWPGEGCGFVALMRYRDALERCERVYAVIKGWGLSSDGRGGLTRPEPEGQMLALGRCYALAGYPIGSVGSFEGHGTGTRVGDTAELHALIESRRRVGAPTVPAVIGSIKANIGHTKAAAGLAGLLKATMCLQEKVLPPTTACHRPHPLFAANPGILAPSDRVLPWQAGAVPRRAGVSAMGFGGINTHIAVEETPVSARTLVAVPDEPDLARFGGAQDAELFLFAAACRQDLAWTVDHFAAFTDRLSRSELTDLAVEMARRATRDALFPWRAAAVAATPAELASRLRSLQTVLASADEPGLHLSVAEGVFLSSGHARGRIGLVFSGQGAPVREDAGVHGRRFGDFGDIYGLAALGAFADKDDTDFAQPAIVAASLAGLAMLRRIGIEGDSAVGHSLGELTALHWARGLDVDDLLAVARARGRAMAEETGARGAMAAIAADRERTAAAIAGHDALFLANINGPSQTVVGGERDAVQALVVRLRESGIGATLLPLRQAFHTPAMAGVAERLRAALAGVRFGPLEGQVLSTLTGDALAPDTDIAAHLCKQLSAPVDFLSAAARAARDVNLLIEVGPGERFANLVRGIADTPALSLDVGGDSLAPFLRAAGAAFVLDRAPRIRNLFTDRYARPFDWFWVPRFLQNPCETVPNAPDVQGDTQPLETLADATPADLSQPAEGGDRDSTSERLRGLIVARTALPSWTLLNGSRMQSDLHLNSITVGEIIAQLGAAYGLPPLVDVTQYADASIAAIAEALDRMRESGARPTADRTKVPDGLIPWVRTFAVTREPVHAPPPRSDLDQGTWEGFGSTDAVADAALNRLNGGSHGNGVIVFLGEEAGEQAERTLIRATRRVIERARESIADLRFTVIQSGSVGGGFARSFFLENEEIETLVINLPAPLDSDAAARIVQEIDGASPGFREVFLGPGDRREEPCLRPVTLGGPPRPVLDSKDLVLVSGGGKGIGAECGYRLARQTGCALLILGRSTPQDSEELAANLARLRAGGVRASYQAADVTNAEAVAEAVARGTADLGTAVTGIIHGAGLNVPRTVANLSFSQLRGIVRPKMEGLRNVLAAIDTGGLKLLVGFGSIIARMGLHGEAHYALANDWLSRSIEAFQERHPGCRCRAIEWSVWSGTGMGQRLGRLDALAAQGIAAISVDDGVRAFLDVVAAPDLPVRTVVSGRFGNLPTLRYPRPQPLALRFIESVPVFYPGIELVAECTLTPETDPYLDDHVLKRERLFPAVMALEAMSQAALTLMGTAPGTWVPRFRDFALHKAIVVPPEPEGIALRLIAQAGSAGEIRLAIRCSATGFQVNHIEARCFIAEADTGAEENPTADAASEPAEDSLPLDADAALYGSILFQKGRFKRIGGYCRLAARGCVAWLSPGAAERWFAPPLPGVLLLGDPGTRDAALHAAQACIPHKILIPIEVEAIRCRPLPDSRPYRIVATEIEDRGDELVFDLDILDMYGHSVERWRRLRFRAMGEPADARLRSLPLLAPLLERKIAAVLPQAGLRVSIKSGTGRSARPRDGLADGRRPDGRPDSLPGGRWLSAAYDRTWRLAVQASIPVGCDLQAVSHKSDRDWEILLGTPDFALARQTATLTGETLEVAAIRIWTAREAMKKAGLAARAPLTVDPGSSQSWVVLDAGLATLFSVAVVPPMGGEVVCAAVALLVAPAAGAMAGSLESAHAMPME